jgi:hypothetical protein
MPINIISSTDDYELKENYTVNLLKYHLTDKVFNIETSSKMMSTEKLVPSKNVVEEINIDQRKVTISFSN